MKIIVFGGIALLILTLWGCGDGAKTLADTKAESKKTRLVKVSHVSASAPEGNVEYVGVLTAYRKVMLASEAGGTIEKIYFEKGDRVRKGQVLAEIGTRSIRLRIREAKAALDNVRECYSCMPIPQSLHTPVSQDPFCMACAPSASPVMP